ncbi:MAG TPA: hypothetical protein VNR00_09040 [Opitutus sp.]|nr:hypothetical protein [Opitutus sp.]
MSLPASSAEPTSGAELSPRRRARLIRRLRSTRAALAEWSDSLQSLTAEHTHVPSETRSLLALLDETKAHLDLRLQQLGDAAAVEAGVRTRRKVTTSTAGFCLRACRACGKALGAAFRDAQAVADAATARILYGSLRAIEKQLWLLDPLRAGR